MYVSPKKVHVNNLDSINKRFPQFQFHYFFKAIRVPDEFVFANENHLICSVKCIPRTSTIHKRILGLRGCASKTHQTYLKKIPNAENSKIILKTCTNFPLQEHKYKILAMLEQDTHTNYKNIKQAHHRTQLKTSNLAEYKNTINGTSCNPRKL